MSIRKFVINGSLTAAMAASLSFVAVPAQADDAGAFIGGVMAARVGSNMRARTQAEQQQAQYAQQQSQQQQVQQAPPPAQKTTEQKMDELDKLAAGGYITPDEYKAKKQQILNSM